MGILVAPELGRSFGDGIQPKDAQDRRKGRELVVLLRLDERVQGWWVVFIIFGHVVNERHKTQGLKHVRAAVHRMETCPRTGMDLEADRQCVRTGQMNRKSASNLLELGWFVPPTNEASYSSPRHKTRACKTAWQDGTISGCHSLID